MTPLSVVALIALGGVVPAAGQQLAQPRAAAAQIERGRYLVTVQDCHGCNTPFTAKGAPDMSRMLPGHPASVKVAAPPRPSGASLVAINDTNTAWSGPWGVSYTTNLTPDRPTGFGASSKQNVIDAIRKGRKFFVLVIASAVVGAVTLLAQAPQTPAVLPKPDTPAVTRHIDAATKAAGTEGQAVTVGDVAFTPVFIPGHTPGSVGYVLLVQAGGRTHTAGLFGGSILIPGRIPDAGLEQYIKSIQHFGDVARKMNVDVELQNHPLYDGFEAKLERLKARRAGQPHPFAVGQPAYQRFLTVMTECTRAQMERRKLL